MPTDNHTLYVCGGLVKPDQFAQLLRDYQKELVRENAQRFRNLRWRHNIKFGEENGTEGYLWVSDEEVFRRLNNEPDPRSIQRIVEEDFNFYWSDWDTVKDRNPEELDHYTGMALNDINNYIYAVIREQQPYTKDNDYQKKIDYYQKKRDYYMKEYSDKIGELFEEQRSNLFKTDYYTYRFNPKLRYEYNSAQEYEYEHSMGKSKYSFKPNENGSGVYGKCGSILTIPDSYIGYIETTAAPLYVGKGKTYDMTLKNVPTSLTDEMILQDLSQFGTIQRIVRETNNNVTVKFSNPGVHQAIKYLFNKFIPFTGVNIEFKINKYQIIN